jgi:serine/threonine-protein kinase
MEYLGGESLGARVDEKGAFSASDVAAIVEQAARALTEAHSHGIIHHDIKPENIILVDDPERDCGFSVKLIDFGLANPGSTQAITPSGGIAGTPHYMSPEYLRGSVKPNPHLDMWALAVTAYVAVTGQAPFEGDSVNEIYRRVTGDPPIPSVVNPDVPPSFDAWFARACAREPSVRFQSAAEMAAALTVACRGFSSVTRSAASVKNANFAPTEPESESASSIRVRGSSGST